MNATLPAVGASALVGVAIIWAPIPRSWVDAPPGAEASAPLPRAAQATAPEAVTATAAAAYVQFRPETPADAANGVLTAAAPPKPSPPVLVGLAQSGPRRVAYVLEAGQTSRAAVGDKVGNWRLTSIGAHDAVLRDGRKVLTLALYRPRPQPPAPETAAPAPGFTPTTPSATPVLPAALPSPRIHAPEPASAPPVRASSAPRGRYWVGPADRAPQGYVVLRPGEAPPQ